MSTIEQTENRIAFVTCPSCTWVNHLVGETDMRHSSAEIDKVLKERLSERFGTHRYKIHPNQALEAKHRVTSL